jgi:hypothetical protein
MLITRQLQKRKKKSFSALLIIHGHKDETSSTASFGKSWRQ